MEAENNKIEPKALSSSKHPQKKNSKFFVLMTLTLLIVLLAFLWFLYWLFYLQFHETTDDAYGNGDMMIINAIVPGSVVGVYVENTDFVQEGQLLVKLDDIPSKLKYEAEIANLKLIVLQVRQLYENVLVARTVVENKKALLQKAQYDYDNRMQLIESKAISNEEYTHSKDTLLLSRLALKEAQHQLQVALDAAGNTSMEKHPTIEKQKEIIRLAYYNWLHCCIYAPVNGYVAQKVVTVGKRLSESTPVMTIIPTENVWVDANFKETQLLSMRVGQPATVWFDIYGSHVQFKGEVLGIASGTGSVFSLIPPQNATGNWIKIVQRLPVRIGLNPEMTKKYPIRLGISATVDVDVSNTELLYLPNVATKKNVSETKVFDLNFKRLDAELDKIIKENLIKNER